MLLKHIVIDNRLKTIKLESGNRDNFLKLILENIWDECFEINFFYLMAEKQIVAHARKIVS
jgi:hypothetical protein